jgi:hypothetical protein
VIGFDEIEITGRTSAINVLREAERLSVSSESATSLGHTPLGLGGI